ncbi:MAG: para-nitrobenzyl esterase [Gammaproteobacteria bacterium]|nr:para-nitrobenzyl esterase [Gammaproteobacteria bacterium]
MMKIERERTEQRFCRAFLALIATLSAAAAPAHATDTKPPRIAVTQGTLEGVQNGAVKMFLGVPFAEPPVGPLRWAPPQPAIPWTGLRSAKSFGARCMQGPIFADMIFRDPGISEDCLTLNVWTPAKHTNAKLPVMVWFFGGGFVAGGTSEPRHDGANLAKNGVVVVTLNYRLGIFGFLVHPALVDESANRASGNYGLLDQTAALRWVQQNIEAFGGDPNNVTIFGESAGSLSVSAQMTSPLAKGLFERAIGESGGAVPFPSMAELAALDAQFVESKLSATTLEQLRALPADKLLDVSMTEGGQGGISFGPDVDGYFLPRSLSEIYTMGQQNDVPLLAGWNRDEAGIRVTATAESFTAMVTSQFGDDAAEILKLYSTTTDAEAVRSASDFAADNFTGFSTWKWLEAAVVTGKQPVYRYSFDRVIPSEPRPPAGRSAYHSGEIPYVFGNLDLLKGFAWSAEDRRISQQMQKYWSNFARNGNPNGPGLPAWPPYSPSSGWQVLHLNGALSVSPDKHRERHLLLNRLRTP